MRRYSIVCSGLAVNTIIVQDGSAVKACPDDDGEFVFFSDAEAELTKVTTERDDALSKVANCEALLLASANIKIAADRELRLMRTMVTELADAIEVRTHGSKQDNDLLFRAGKLLEAKP